MSENFADENSENMPPNVLKPYDAEANIIAVSNAKIANNNEIKRNPMDNLTYHDIGKTLTVTETSIYNPGKIKSISGILKSIRIDDYGNVGSINIEELNGNERGMSNLRSLNVYTVKKQYDPIANTIEVSNALAKNNSPIKSPIDKITTDYIGQKLEITETLAPNPRIPFPSESKTYTGILRSINPNYNGSLVSSIELEKSSGQTITIQNLRDSYIYIVKIFKGGLKHSNSKKRKSFRRKRNKKSLKRRKSRRTLKYKR